MKKIGLTSTTIDALDTEFKAAAANIDTLSIFREMKQTLNDAISSQNYEKVLLYYDNKGLLAEMARQLGLTQKSLEEFVGRALSSDDSSELHRALTNCLPRVMPRI